MRSPYPFTQDAGYERVPREQLGALPADAPVGPLLDDRAVAERAASPEPAGTGGRFAMEQVLALNGWLTDYRVRVEV